MHAILNNIVNKITVEKGDKLYEIDETNLLLTKKQNKTGNTIEIKEIVFMKCSDRSWMKSLGPLEIEKRSQNLSNWYGRLQFKFVISLRVRISVKCKWYFAENDSVQKLFTPNCS